MSQLDRGYLIDEQFVKWCKPPTNKMKAKGGSTPSKSELFIQEYKGVYGLAAILDAMDLLNIKTGWSEEDSSIDDLSDKDIVKLGWYLRDWVDPLEGKTRPESPEPEE
ncbi:hypothetical protein H2203_006833 [Taxawa tesnikishii (nom. ined.)]|nr:hypothetical protein H2203_006833 [Dothideales sp. JES 119]